eukprot:COSAG01_NODE_7415_length_3217_cov_2.997114_2_plen_114_part_00
MTALAKKLMTETVEKVRAPFEEGAGSGGGAAEFRLRKLKKVEGEASCPVSQLSQLSQLSGVRTWTSLPATSAAAAAACLPAQPVRWCQRCFVHMLWVGEGALTEGRPRQAGSA